MFVGYFHAFKLTANRVCDLSPRPAPPPR
jgi:hypothetical protein